MIDSARLEDQTAAVIALLRDLAILQKNESESQQEFAERLFADFSAASVEDVDTGVEILTFPASCSELSSKLDTTLSAV